LVRDQPDPPFLNLTNVGGLAQLGEHLLCKQGVVGSIPSSSTTQQALNTKAASISKDLEASLLLIGIYRSIGCSLTIHRVESALSAETAFMADRAAGNN
jgi:hypothetical protein